MSGTTNRTGYDQPNRLRLTCQIAADGRVEPDPDTASIVDVMGSGGDDTTTVTIVRSHIDRHGPESGAICRQEMDSDEGWPKCVKRCRAVVRNA